MIPINKRKTVTCILLSFVTFGIFAIYWQYLLVKNMRAIKNDNSSCLGEMLCILLVPFYSLYWWFTRGKTLKDKLAGCGYSAAGSENVYLILSIFGLGLISMAIMQNDFNLLPSEISANEMKSNQKSAFVMDKRKIVTRIILSYVTLGIYPIYWKYLLVKKTRAIKNENSHCLGEMLCILFIPFYSLYWWATRGNMVKEKFADYGYCVTGNGSAYLVLGIFGHEIISMTIMQNDFDFLMAEISAGGIESNRPSAFVMDEHTVLMMQGITMTFPGVKALDHVDFKLRKGEIHALMGENGAGKSTLIKCLTGVNDFEAGEIHIDGIPEAIKNRNTLDAQKKGISTVYQEVNLCPNLSVAENLFIGREPMTKLHTINRKEMVKRAQKLMEQMQLPVDVTRNLDEYSLALQQMIAIARAVDMDCKVLILDEPTSSLDDSEVEKLFALMRRLRDQGVGIIFVTHFLEQVYAVCDRITVLRNGQLVGEYPIAELPRVKLIAAMMGKDFDDLASIKPEGGMQSGGTDLIDAQGLSHAGKIKPFDLKLNSGEVVGLTGLLGSGRSELARAIYGADKAQTGTLKVKGKEVHIKHPIDAMNLGMAMLPDDRKAEGIIGDLSVRENIVLAMQARRGITKLIPMKEQEEIADKFIELLQIKTASRETPVKQLSGGNQQKVIIARWLATDPDFLILDEPTRGIDVGTKTEIQKLVIQLAQQGKSVLFISSEIEEMLRTCSRLAVLRDGAKIGELSGEMTQELVMKTIAEG